MDLDQEVCLCFHVTRRKIESFIRHEQPQRASQLTECYGAGTGCKWCVRYLKAIFEAAAKPSADPEPGKQPLAKHALPSAEQYAAMRQAYRKSKNDADSSVNLDSDSGPPAPDAS